MIFRNFRRKERLSHKKKITCLLLNEQASLYGGESSFFLTLEDRCEEYEDRYLWNYIQRDIICSVLENYVTYVYTSDEENFNVLKIAVGEAPSYKETSNGVIQFLCEHLYSISTRLIEEYWEIWECGGPSYITFVAYNKEKGICGEDEKVGYDVKVKPLGDNAGIGFWIDDVRYSRENLVKSIMLVLERYGLSLSVVLC